MSCNNKHDFPFATTVVGEVKDSFMASVGFENGKYLKLGNVLTVAQIGGHAYHGEWENVAQDVGVWAATTAIALAIASNHLGIAMPNHSLAIGELGLSGEVRPVSQMDLRIKEAHRLGFDEIVIPGNGKVVSNTAKLKLISVTRLNDAIDWLKTKRASK